MNKNMLLLIVFQASEREMIWVIRISIMVVGAIATTIGLTVSSIYGLSILCSDLIYVILFPQLICVLYFRYSNGYGATISFFIGLFARLLGGEPMLSKLIYKLNSLVYSLISLEPKRLGYIGSCLCIYMATSYVMGHQGIGTRRTLKQSNTLFTDPLRNFIEIL